MSLQGVTETAHQVDVSLNGDARSATCAFDGQARPDLLVLRAEHRRGRQPAHARGRGRRRATSRGRERRARLPAHVRRRRRRPRADGAGGATRLTIAGFASPSCASSTSPTRAIPSSWPSPSIAQGATSSARVDTPRRARRRARCTRSRTGEGRRAGGGRRATRPRRGAASHDGELVILSHARVPGRAGAARRAPRRRRAGRSQLVDRAGRLRRVRRVRRQDRPRRSATFFSARGRAGACRPASCCSWATPPSIRATSSGMGDFDFAPTRLIDTTAMETASDDWFVDDDLDGVPEVAIGRLPGAHGRAGERRRRAEDARATRARPISRAAACSSPTPTTSTSTSRPRARPPRRRSPTSCRSIASSAAPAGRPRRAAREARRGPVPGELPRPRLGRGVGRPAHERPGRGPHQRPRARSTSS